MRARVPSGFRKTTFVVTIRHVHLTGFLCVRNKNMTVFVFMFHCNTRTVVFFLLLRLSMISLFHFLLLLFEGRRGMVNNSHALNEYIRCNRVTRRPKRKTTFGQSAFNVLTRVYIIYIIHL